MGKLFRPAGWWAVLLVPVALAGSLPAAEPARQPPNLLLVTLDTTRADRLGIAGWASARTPNLDRLARHGVRFERCDTAAPITLPSHASILTGLYPLHHGVRDNATFVLAERHPTLAEVLRDRGYDTGAVVAAVVLARRHRLDQGFRLYDDDLGAGYTAGTQVGERDAAAVTDAALAMLGKLRAPYLLWVHYYDPHEEYRPPSRFADLGGPSPQYDGEIAYVDEQLGRLLQAVGETSVVAVVGDHGEMLGEHGEATHGLLLFAGARRVPLLLAGPGVPTGVTESCLTRTVDLLPTLLGLAGAPIPGDLDGRPLLPLPSASGDCGRISYSESFLPFFAYRWYPPRALSDGGWLLLRSPSAALYSVAGPRPEREDRAAGESIRLAGLDRRLGRLLAGAGESLEMEARAENALDAEQRRKLESLGYVGGAGGGRVTAALPDTRTMTDVATQLHDLHREVQQGRCAAALRPLASIVERDRDNFPALNLAGYCLRELGRTADAVPLFERAIKVNELSAVPVTNLAGALRDLGRTADAMREYRRALTLDPTQTEAATNLARLLRERGTTHEALAVLDAAWAAGARAGVVALERGTVRAELGDLNGALADFREAARRDPADPVPIEDAARTAFQLGQLEVAAQLYEQLVRLVASRGDLWKTLGALYLELDRPRDAEAAFRAALRLEVVPVERAQLERLLGELHQ